MYLTIHVVKAVMSIASGKRAKESGMLLVLVAVVVPVAMVLMMVQ